MSKVSCCVASLLGSLAPGSFAITGALILTWKRIGGR
jgi:hypothetical protein